MTHPRGDADILINGEPHKLRLTLGALAEIETALGGDFDALQARLKRPRVSDILLILHALLIGGGSSLSLASLKGAQVDLAEAAGAIANAFAALGAQSPEKPPGKAPTGEAAKPCPNKKT